MSFVLLIFHVIVVVFVALFIFFLFWILFFLFSIANLDFVIRLRLLYLDLVFLFFLPPNVVRQTVAEVPDSAF